MTPLDQMLASRIVEASPDPLILFSDSFQIMFWNRSAMELFGYTEQEARGRSVLDLIAPDQRHASVQQALKEFRRKAGAIFVRALDKKGIIFPAEFALVPFEDEPRSPTLLVIKDLRNVGRIATDFLQTIETEKAGSEEGEVRPVLPGFDELRYEAVKKFAWGMAHHLNNLLEIILGFSDVILQDLNEIDPGGTRVNKVREIRTAGLRGAEIASALLAIGGNQLLQLIPLDLNVGLKSTMSAVRRLLGPTIHLETVFANNLGKIEGDPSIVGQIILALALYAREASGSQGKVIIQTANVELSISMPSRYGNIPAGRYVTLRITYSNHVPGYEELAHLFEPFARGLEGGLDLPAVYGALKQLKSYIAVIPVNEQLTSLLVYFPRLGD